MLQKLIDSHKYKVGDRVSWTQKYEGYTPRTCTGTIIAVHPYGMAAFYVVEHYIVVDFTLTMIHSTAARNPE